MKQLNYISLFSSAGVGCYGFNQENFKCISTCEIDSKRIEIQKNNQICENPEEYITGDIQEIQIQDRIFNNVRAYKERNNIKDLTLLIATPPCQGISVANHKKKNELNRNSLIVESFKITKKIKPKFFIYENVQSFLKTFCTDIDGELIQIQDAMNKNLLQDYFISSKVVNLKNYGSNSSRTRTIVIGVRRDQKINPERLFPDITEPKIIKELINKLDIINFRASRVDGRFANKKLMFTGGFKNMSRSEAKTLAENNGGKVLGSISKKLDFLVVGESNPTKRKIDYAKELNIQIISEKEWNEILNR